MPLITRLAILAALALPLLGLTQAKGPTLTEVQKLEVQVASQQVELSQLRAQVAACVLQQKIGAVTPPGYRLTNTLDLEPVPPEPPAAEKKESP